MDTTVEHHIEPGLSYLVKEPKVVSPVRKGIILLHGVGSNERDLFALADSLPDDFYIIAARGQFTLSPGRYAWYEVNFSTGKPVYNTQQEVSSRAVITNFVQWAKAEYQLTEVYLGGFSQGAIMSYTIGLTQPALVKGIIALSGRLLEEIKPEVIATNPAFKLLNVFIAHGTQDGTLPVAYAQQAKAYLTQLGVPLTYHEYVMAHQIIPAVLNDLSQWLNS